MIHFSHPSHSAIANCTSLVYAIHLWLNELISKEKKKTWSEFNPHFRSVYQSCYTVQIGLTRSSVRSMYTLFLLNIGSFSKLPHISWMSPTIFVCLYSNFKDFPGDSDGKVSTCIAEDQGLSPGFIRLPADGNGYPLQYSCLENPVDRGSWQATVYGVARNLAWLSSNFHFTQISLLQRNLISLQFKLNSVGLTFFSWWNLNVTIVSSYRRKLIMLLNIYSSLYFLSVGLKPVFPVIL